jgi:hypothetical protein
LTGSKERRMIKRQESDFMISRLRLQDKIRLMAGS